MKHSYDVIVVGAGPAGATLAYELAKKGIEVLLLEKEKQPRYKCCAGGLTAKAAKLLDFDISQVVEDVVYDVSVICNSDAPYLGHHSEPLIYTVMRDEFDYLLVKKAQQSGAVVIDGQEATQIETSADWVEVTTAGNVFRSRVLAGADGAYSVVSRKLDMKRNIEYVAGIEMELAVPEEELVKRRSRAEIDLRCVPGGYAWIFPKRNHLSIGAGCLASKAKDLKRYCERFLCSLNISDHTVLRTSRHLIPTLKGKTMVSHDKTLLLGDAAGIADPLTGEGIYNAIQSAQLAAPVVVNSLAQGKIELEGYQRLVEERILSEMTIARTLSGIITLLPSLGFRMLGSDHGVWSACCSLLRGEMNYSTIKKELGGLASILASLARTC